MKAKINKYSISFNAWYLKSLNKEMNLVLFLYSIFIGYDQKVNILFFITTYY
jgi:hypothetical protein